MIYSKLTHLEPPSSILMTLHALKPIVNRHGPTMVRLPWKLLMVKYLFMVLMVLMLMYNSILTSFPLATLISLLIIYLMHLPRLISSFPPTTEIFPSPITFLAPCNGPPTATPRYPADQN